MKKRSVDKKIKNFQALLEKMEPLENARLKRWRSMIVFLFAFGFFLAMLWVFYNGYESKIYAHSVYVKNIILLEYSNQNEKDRVLAKPLIIPMTEASIEKKPEIDLGNWEKYFSVKDKDDLLVLQSADKKSVSLGDIITYNIFILARPGKVYKSLVLYDFLPKGAELIWDKTMSKDGFRQDGNIIQWTLGDFGSRNDGKPVFLVKKFHVRIK